MPQSPQGCRAIALLFHCALCESVALSPLQDNNGAQISCLAVMRKSALSSQSVTHGRVGGCPFAICQVHSLYYMAAHRTVGMEVSDASASTHSTVIPV